MLRNLENRVVLPLCIYAVTAVWCWLTPARLAIDEVDSVLNIFPTKALALATVALAIVHGTFALGGRLVLGVAGLWALATTWMVTMFWLTPFTHSGIRLIYILAVAGAACALGVLGWHLLRRRLAVDVNWIARGLAVLGIAGLVFNYAVLTLRAGGALDQPFGLSDTAGVTAGLTVDLWINSTILVLGAVIHIAASRLRSRSNAA